METTKYPQLEEKMINAMSDVFSVLSNENRIKTLYYFNEHKNPSEITNLLNISRTGVQKHLDILYGSGMIERVKKKYKITTKGELFIEFCKKIEKPLNEMIELQELYLINDNFENATKIMNDRYDKEGIQSLLEYVNKRINEIGWEYKP